MAADSRSVASFLRFSKLGEAYAPSDLESGKSGFRVAQDGVEAVFAHSGVPMRLIAYIEFGDGWVRGNHYHLRKVEHLCVLKGQLEARYFLPFAQKDLLAVTLRAGDMVEVLPGCVHEYTSAGFSAALEFSPQEFSAEDTIPFKVEKV